MYHYREWTLLMWFCFFQNVDKKKLAQVLLQQPKNVSNMAQNIKEQKTLSAKNS